MLDEHGVWADFVDIDEVSDLGRYEAVVLGSAVYMGQMAEASAPLRRCELAAQVRR